MGKQQQPKQQRNKNGIKRFTGKDTYGFEEESAVKMGRDNFASPVFKFKNERQKNAYDFIKSKALTFLIGAAGTGKTFLAVKAIVDLYRDGDINGDTFDGIIITRPAQEAAGEQLGFLPGSEGEKLEPYMRPIVDAFHELIGKDAYSEMVADGKLIIEGLGFLRGRSFKRKIILVDEGQNATREGLKMATTRIGEGSVMIVTMDPSQIDLPKDGLGNSNSCCNDVGYFRDRDNIGFMIFPNSDIVRSRIVREVVAIYKEIEQPKVA